MPQGDHPRLGTSGSAGNGWDPQDPQAAGMLQRVLPLRIEVVSSRGASSPAVGGGDSARED